MSLDHYKAVAFHSESPLLHFLHLDKFVLVIMAVISDQDAALAQLVAAQPSHV